jgi:ubiquinone/menaquinone biosynthesis C-methylase UbiE
LQLTLNLLEGLVPNGPTDPIAYYRRPLFGWFFRERINLGLRMIAGRRYAKALEIGYGAGAVLLAIAAGVDEIQGIDRDADPAPIQEWLNRHGRDARLIRGTVYQLPYQTAEFDLVLSFSVFEHLQWYEQGLREVARVLKPGGGFLLGMPAVNPMMKIGFRALGFKSITEHHITTPGAVVRAFDRAGLRVARHAQLRLIPGLPLYYNWLLEKVT